MQGKSLGRMGYIKKALLKIKAAFNHGLSPKELALSISLAAVLGVFPFFYVPTILVVLTAFIFRLNLAVMMAVNYLVYPLQIVLFLPLPVIRFLLLPLNKVLLLVLLL